MDWCMLSSSSLNKGLSVNSPALAGHCVFWPKPPVAKSEAANNGGVTGLWGHSYMGPCWEDFWTLFWKHRFIKTKLQKYNKTYFIFTKYVPSWLRVCCSCVIFPAPHFCTKSQNGFTWTINSLNSARQYKVTSRVSSSLGWVPRCGQIYFVVPLQVLSLCWKNSPMPLFRGWWVLNITYWLSCEIWAM